MTRQELVKIITGILEDTVKDEYLQQRFMECFSGEFSRQESHITVNSRERKKVSFIPKVEDENV